VKTAISSEGLLTLVDIEGVRALLKNPSRIALAAYAAPTSSKWSERSLAHSFNTTR
jgi:hypothetical protein